MPRVFVSLYSSWQCASFRSLLQGPQLRVKKTWQRTMYARTLGVTCRQMLRAAEAAPWGFAPSSDADGCEQCSCTRLLMVPSWRLSSTAGGGAGKALRSAR